MNLNKVKTEINKLSKEIGKKEEPTLPNFFRFCEKEYGRPVDYGEIWFNTYYRHNIKCKSNPILFLRLSEKYFKDIHQVDNPVKDGEHSMKSRALMDWSTLHNDGRSSPEIRRKILEEDQEFNEWFEDAWNEIIVNGSLAKYNQLIIDADNHIREKY